MPITPYLAGQAFKPELIREMSLALERVCDTPNLRLTDDANTRLVASKIVELAQRGVRDAASLSAMTLREFKHYSSGSLAMFAAIRPRFAIIPDRTDRDSGLLKEFADRLVILRQPT